MGGLRSEALPEYSRPPVVEVAVGVEFLPKDQLGTVELVRLHDVWSVDYPHIELQPELFSPSRYASQLPAVFNTGVPPVRLWSLSEDRNTLVQVQADRLVINWRRLEGDSPYPHYDALRAEFTHRWNQLRERLEQLGAGQPRVGIAEVTYVNEIHHDPSLGPAGALAFLQDPPELLPASSWQIQRMTRLVSEADVDDGGALTLTAVAEEPGRIRLDIVTRLGLDLQREDVDPFPALDRAHELGVRAFTASTTDHMHLNWGRLA